MWTVSEMFQVPARWKTKRLNKTDVFYHKTEQMWFMLIMLILVQTMDAYIDIRIFENLPVIVASSQPRMKEVHMLHEALAWDACPRKPRTSPTGGAAGGAVYCNQ